MKRNILSALFLLLCLGAWAQDFDKKSYYAAADGKKGAALKTALKSIINSHTALSYSDLWDAFKTTDRRPDGKVWDIYSSTTNYVFGTDQAGNYKKEGDVYNREHSFPKSWFGDAHPFYTDLYHLYPSDGYVNGKRSNYAFGEVGSATYTSNGGFCKLGSPTQALKNAGCNLSVVFEPNDIYKGDLARTYFYMVTAYEDYIAGWYKNNKEAQQMLDGKTYPGYKNWAVTMFLDWTENDPVSEKETDRIEAVYSYQHNRNPFIDFPGLEEYIWGSCTDKPFSVEHYVNPYTGETDGLAPVLPDFAVQHYIYDLQGRPVTHPTRRGIYIINGRKVVK